VKKIAIIVSALLVFGTAASTETSILPIDFQSRSEMNQWRAVNDGVMGGRSSGGPSFENGHLVFSGVINTNGGGFSSVRRRVQSGAMSGAQTVTMRIKSDGRDYRLRFRTDVTWRGRRIAFQKPIPNTKAGEWETVTITLDNMRASLFGRTVRGANFVPDDVIETGVILADGQDGPFRLEIDWIQVN